RHRIGQPEHRELFRFRIEHDQRISRRARDDDRILPHAERIELIHPQEIWILGAARLASCARELRSGQIPRTELSGLWIEPAESCPPPDENHSVPSVRKVIQCGGRGGGGNGYSLNGRVFGLSMKFLFCPPLT